MTIAARALIADDEPLLREALVLELARVWPELVIVAQARNGREAIARFEELQPDVCFLDVQMPGTSGIEVAQYIGRRAHAVFVTAFDHYAVQAFAQGVLDYLVKPVDQARLAETVLRIKERIISAQPVANMDSLLAQLAAQLTQTAAPQPLQWLRASCGQLVRLIAVADIDYLRSDTKYTRIAWRGDGGLASEALIRTPLKDVLVQLDARQFVQVHRSVVVNLHAIKHVHFGDQDGAEIHLKHRAELLPVSRSYLHLFRQM